MPTTRYASLQDLRLAITSRSVIKFSYHGDLVELDPYLLGHAVKTQALVVVGWERDPGRTWRSYRYSEMRGLVITPLPADELRGDFDAGAWRIARIDTAVAGHRAVRTAREIRAA